MEGLGQSVRPALHLEGRVWKVGIQSRSPGFWPGPLTKNRHQNWSWALLTKVQANPWSC